MTPVPMLLRRSPGCVSDLTIDRWLLGETPGSDEARRVEEHMERCTSCAARIGALRGLYSTQLPEPRHEPPVPAQQATEHASADAGALQFVILRDGLLVGTEFFTSGSYFIGSDARADLRLDGIRPLHARIFFRDGRVAMKAEGGSLYVNGYKVESCELRPIDEAQVGPYVLRSRVIRERWSDAEPQPKVPVDDAREDTVTAKTVVDELPSQTVLEPQRSPSTPTRLTVELWWGESRQAAASFERAVTARDFALWGFDVVPDFVLARPAPGGFTVQPPGGERLISLGLGERFACSAGAMRLTFSVDPILAELPPPAFVSWPVVGLSATMLLAFFLAVAVAPLPDEDRFTPKDLHLPAVTLVMPHKPSHRAPTLQLRPTPKEPVHQSRPKGSDKPVGSRKDPHSNAAFSSLASVLGAASKVLNAPLPAAAPGRGRRGPLFSTPTGVPGGAPVLSFMQSPPGPLIIGGFKSGKAGTMGTAGIGIGAVGGQTTGVVVAERKVSVDIDKEQVRRAILSHEHEVQECYEHALISHGHDSGRLVLAWTITTAGTVAQTRQKSSTLKDASIASCILAKLKQWRFPKARGGSIEVSYPFVFQPSEF